MFFTPNYVSMQLFGWDLKTLWQTANQNRCHAFLLAGRLAEAGGAYGAYRFMMDTSDATTTDNCGDWAVGKLSAMTLPTFLTSILLSFPTRMSITLYK